MLEKMGTKKRYEYHPNDQLQFQLIGEDFFRKDEIVALRDSTIIFAAAIVPLREIVQIKPPVTAWMAATGGTLMVAGIGYFLIDTFNQTIVAGNGYSTDESVVRASAIMAGTGAALVIFSRKKVKIRNNWRIRMVEIY